MTLTPWMLPYLADQGSSRHYTEIPRERQRRISTALSVERVVSQVAACMYHIQCDVATVLAYSAWLQDCSTSHLTSTNHLRGCANPHPSRENHPSGLIIEASDHPSPANQSYPSCRHLHQHARRPSTRTRMLSLRVVGSYCMNQVNFSVTRTSKIDHTFVVHWPSTPSVSKLSPNLGISSRWHE